MSSDQITLELSQREILGKKVKHLRSKGLVPAVIHNHGQDSLILQGSGKDMLKVYMEAGKHHPVVVNIGSKKFTTLIKDVEFEHRHQDLVHIVFNAVSADQKVEAEVPIHAKFSEGNEASPAERSGLMVLNNLETVMIAAFPQDIPDVVYYDAEKLINIGDHIRVSDLIIPKDVVLKTDLNSQVASVFEPSAVAAANDAVGGTDEEVTQESTEEPEADADTPEDAA